VSAAADRWLAFAREDLRVAELAFAEGIYNQACFHAHQCAEKALKRTLALLQREIAPPRTHSIVELLGLLPAPCFAGLRAELAEGWTITTFPRDIRTRFLGACRKDCLAEPTPKRRLPWPNAHSKRRSGLLGKDSGHSVEQGQKGPPGFGIVGQFGS
jgi:hypothetical protein